MGVRPDTHKKSVAKDVCKHLQMFVKVYLLVSIDQIFVQTANWNSFSRVCECPEEQYKSWKILLIFPTWHGICEKTKTNANSSKHLKLFRSHLTNIPFANSIFKRFAHRWVQSLILSTEMWFRILQKPLNREYFSVSGNLKTYDLKYA